MISTVNLGAASRDSTHARAGALPGETQASQTWFISSKVAMSASQICALKSRDLVAVFEDISDVAYVCHEDNDDILCKVIIETALLTEEEKIIACQIARMAGADFVKTSTGFSTGGATVEDIALMRAVVGEGMGVKASGGVRTLADAQAMVAAGANRIGASAGVSIAQEEAGFVIANNGSTSGENY